MKTLGKIIVLFCIFVLGFYFGGKEQTVGLRFDMPEEIGQAQKGDFLIVERVVENDSLKVVTLEYFGKN